MEKMFIVTAATGEYADKCKYNVFVCNSKESADTCLRAIDNWFQLQGHQKTIGKHEYLPRDWSEGVNIGRHECADAFTKQFGVYISIDYTGVEFTVEPVKVFHGDGA